MSDGASGDVLVLRARAALGESKRQRALARVRTVAPGVTNLSTRWVHLVYATRALTDAERAQLDRMFEYGPAPADVAAVAQIWVAPRFGTISPWSSKATDIAHVCGLAAITRIERIVEYSFAGGAPDLDAVSGVLSDRMTESVLGDLDGVRRYHLAAARRPGTLGHVALGPDGAATLRAASSTLGLALAEDEIEYLVRKYRELGRDPTDVELMMFAQANSEHCRHKIFNAEWFVDGTKQDHSLFQWIKKSTEAAPTGVLSAYKDNAAVVEGSAAARFFPDGDGVYRAHAEAVHVLGKVETHNHPTAISPFPGAATGSGGEIRDEGATGRGAKPKAGLVGFTVSDLRLPNALEPWEPAAAAWIGKPGRIASALDIMTEGPLGGAAYNNEFGRPAILGYFRTYEHADRPGLARGYHKPVMLAGGIGSVRAEHVQKAPVPAGAALIVLGGPAFLIGLGGGAASSLAQGASAEDLDFASVQRDNAEIERRCQEVIDRCWAQGAANPILSIHDVGAGGLSNALPELVHDAGLGAKLSLAAIPRGEAGLSPLEVWCNESQERYVLAIAADRLADFAALCARERAPWAHVGDATAEGHLLLADETSNPVDVPLELILGKAPRMTRRATTTEPARRALDLGGATIAQALDRVLGLPTVADKSFLVTIGDRTVGGLIARDSMVGPHQVPVADCALTLAGFDTYAGEVMAMGERPPVALLDAAAASRLAIAEAITNLAAAPIGPLHRIKLSCNWMAAAGADGEDARLYAAVRAAGECAVALGISIPVGKDSMSMRTVWSAPSASASSGRARTTTSLGTVAAAPQGSLGAISLPAIDVIDPAEAALRDLEKSLGDATPATDDEDAALARLARDRAKANPAEDPAPQQLADAERQHARNQHSPRDVAHEIAADHAIARAVAATDSIDAAITSRTATRPGLGMLASRAKSDTQLGPGAVGPVATCPASEQPAARSVVSPVTLVVTAFGPVTDVRLNVTPELQGHELLLVDLAAGQGRLGGSCLAQVFCQVGDTPPDLDDPKRLLAFYAAMQDLVAAKAITAYHDRSDGGLVVTALEMAFASGLGLELDTTAVHVDPVAALFAEELGAIIETTDGPRVRAALEAAGARVVALGRAIPGNRVVIRHGGSTVIDAPRTQLRARWSHVTHAMAALRDDPTCAAEEHATRTDAEAPGLTAHLTFDPAQAPAVHTGARPRVAILREQGVNGQIEMAAAFTRAGFDAVDVHMTDLIEGRANLADMRGAVACGGFSFGDVLGAGRGWATTFRYNARARDALAAFTARSDTFLLGVCNGCQMLADLADQLPGAAPWPRFVRNRSEQFEARVVLLAIEESRSIFFQGMAGSRIPVANAHGEGRAELDAHGAAALAQAGLVAARYVDGRGAIATTYPANPNGSPAGIASLTTPDGRLTIMMPHPERVFRTAQLSWHPREWGEDSPWMRMFRNARAWV